MDDIDRALLSEAIALSAQAVAEGNPPFGSLLTDVDRRVLARERNTTLTDNDITAHPELKLARLAAALGHPATTLYTSCRPCPMCANAVARSGIARVVFALDTSDLDALKPPGFVNPDAGSPSYAGPALVADAAAVVRGFY